MNIYSIVVIFIILVVAFSYLKDKFKGESDSIITEEGHLYKKKQYFFSINERKFYEILKEVSQELNMELFAKVRLADVLYSVDKGREWRYGGFSKIKSKHLDFLLCDKKDYSPLIAIELDDSSHFNDSSRKRDGVKNDSLQIADMKLVRFPTKMVYSKEEIKSKLI